MQRKLIQIAGIVWTVVYASIIVWIYATEPRSFKEVTTNTRVAAGIYEVNQEKFNNGLELFRRDRKSTRLNSSHVRTSYAVFCLKKKNIIKQLEKRTAT